MQVGRTAGPSTEEMAYVGASSNRDSERVKSAERARWREQQESLIR
jgi:hypothetical protein